MPPTLAAKNAGNSGWIYSETPRQVSSFSIRAMIIASDIENYFIGQFGKRMLTAFWRAAFSTPLRIHISHIVELLTYKQMRRIAANRIVALVTDVIVTGIAVSELVSKTVDIVAGALKTKSPVATLFPRSGPFPAIGFTPLTDAKPKRARDRTITLARYGKRFGAVGTMLEWHVPLIAYPNEGRKMDSDYG